MKLDHDVIRDLLLAIEEISDGSINFNVEYIHEKNLPEYELKVLRYHVKQLAQGGFVQVSTGCSDYIIDLTWSGHQYIANIRDETVWSETKKIVGPLGSVAVNVISETARSVLFSALGLNS